ncbi:thioredoxin family protein [Alkalihalobacillus oceani]|uniref:Thioredoxin family protein n=1 Tax=Halalkalibacter oceani TaxID=1653776 RepID=A0A9X2DRU7_9BACI|nr:thioredoxin family protein [Halalkalibacter oceani]MCM3715884.1 thioredoxin family protein [Halalkalibacter oceani]
MKVTNITLFTMSACPLGRTMRHVLEEVTTLLPELTFSIVFIDLEPELTNEARISNNPTTLFRDKNGKEVNRVEGFMETDEVIQLIKTKKNYTTLPSGAKREKSVESYTIYLLNGDALEAVDIDFTNPTPVKTPRITAINLLLEADLQPLINPFPDSATLELVEFEEDLARVYIIHEEKTISERNAYKMKRCLQQTLHSFGIEKVELILKDYKTHNSI